MNAKLRKALHSPKARIAIVLTAAAVVVVALVKRQAPAADATAAPATSTNGFGDVLPTSGGFGFSTSDGSVDTIAGDGSAVDLPPITVTIEPPVIGDPSGGSSDQPVTPPILPTSGSTSSGTTSTTPVSVAVTPPSKPPATATPPSPPTVRVGTDKTKSTWSGYYKSGGKIYFQNNQGSIAGPIAASAVPKGATVYASKPR